jgi:hypothetical protein
MLYKHIPTFEIGMNITGDVNEYGFFPYLEDSDEAKLFLVTYSLI